MKLFDFRSTCPDAEPFFNESQPQVTGGFLVRFSAEQFFNESQP